MNIDAPLKFIAKGVKLIEYDKNIIYFNDCLKSAEAAKNIADTDEKKAYLFDAAVKWSNQLAFILFRHDLFDDKLLAEFRALETPENSTAAVKVFQDIAQKETDEVRAAQETVMAKQKSLDIFKGVIGGMALEEAEAKMAEYEEQLRQAQMQG